MSADNPTIGVAAASGGLYVALRGRATQRVCSTVEKVVGDYLDSDPKPAIVVLDLDKCGWIDSTFAGWMVGVQRRVSRIAGSRIGLVNCSERCRGSLMKMQLEPLFPNEDGPPPAEMRDVVCSTSDRPDRNALRLMLEAHEQLASVSESNARVFGPIAETLKRQLATMRN